MSRIPPEIKLDKKSNRLYYVVRYPRMEIDITPVYFFLKEMFEYKVEESK
jgi:hypothetical protein